jgi:predicted metal-dependent phosphotriesterase family hydrolase
MTVCGRIEADEQGITLPHEHLFVDATNQSIESSDPTHPVSLTDNACPKLTSWQSLGGTRQGG